MPLALAAWLLAAAPVLPARALSPELDMGVASRVRPADKALISLSTKPRDALVELRRLYDRYTALVESKREDAGWSYGLVSEELSSGDEDVIVPARQLEEAAKSRAAELAALKAKLAAGEQTLPQAALEDLRWQVEKKRREARAAARAAAREKGTCVDWSDLVWFTLRGLDLQDWSVQDTTRQAPPRHTAAVLCTPADSPELCLAFDPSITGEPDVYEFESWDKGSRAGRLPPEFFLHHLPGR